MRAKTKPTTTGANPQRVRADQERRRSGAHGFHPTTTRRQRTRSGARNAAIRENY